MPTTPTATSSDQSLPPGLLQDTASLFGLLSATVRLHILWLLAHGDQDVGTLADKTDQTVATVSHHLAKLKLAGLVRARRHGKRHVYTATDSHVLQIIQLAIGDKAQRAQPRGRTRHA